MNKNNTKYKTILLTLEKKSGKIFRKNTKETVLFPVLVCTSGISLKDKCYFIIKNVTK